MDDDHIMVVTMGKVYIINKKKEEVCLSFFDENSYSLLKRDSNTPCMNVVPEEGRLVLRYDEEKYKQSLVQFRGARMNDGQYQIAFEVMKHNLFQFLEIGNHDPSKWTFVFSTLVTGLMKLHKKGIYHTRINPWNIVLASDNTALFCGFSNLQKPKDHEKRTELEAKDLQDLAALIAYCKNDKLVRSDSEESYPTDGRYLIASIKESAAKDAALRLFDGRYHKTPFIIGKISLVPWCSRKDMRKLSYIDPDCLKHGIRYAHFGLFCLPPTLEEQFSSMQSKNYSKVGKHGLKASSKDLYEEPIDNE